MYSLKFTTLLFVVAALWKCAGTVESTIQDRYLYKVSPSLKRYLANTDKRKKGIFILSGHSIENLKSALSEGRNKFKVLDLNIPSNSIKVECIAGNLMQSILTRPEIIFIDKYENPHEESIIKGYDRSFHGINLIDQHMPNANGKNVVVGIKERKMNEEDIDLFKRIKPSSISSIEISDHATSIATLVGGAGNSYYTGKGIANECLFFPSSFDNLFADEISILKSNKVTVQNHSYGTIIQNFYGAEAVSYDAQTWNNQNIVHVFSAGNSGELTAPDGKYRIAGFANTTANFKAAKNILLTGAVDNTGLHSIKSSSGPLYDGRLAPHLVALGPNGTSDAAAILSGTVAVMQQVYADKNNGKLPPAALLKAILLNTADDIFSPGIDFKTGYGLLDSWSAIKSILNNDFFEDLLSSGQIWEKDIITTDQIKQLKITLSWTDSAAAVQNQKAIINDLDLEVVDLKNNKVYLPWCLNTFPHKDSLEKTPIRARDSLNTAEQVTIEKPSGIFRIKVKASALPSGKIPFCISIISDTLNRFIFTSPIHSSEIKTTNENLVIKWRAVVQENAVSGNLFHSFDQGFSWHLIKNNVSLKNGMYLWQIKDTSTTLMFKMQTPFGDFFSNQIIFDKPSSLKMEYHCTDSIRLSWAASIYATSYKLYALADTPYLRYITTLSDTFVVLHKSQFPFQVFAIEPQVSNEILPHRSEAFSTQNSRTFCYFNSFYFNAVDGNRVDLILKLSTITNIDSVIFEEVTSAGRLIKEIKKTVVNRQNQLSTLTEELAPGISYFRCRIKLKNGGIAYTEIIYTITSGKENFLIYPNPMSKNSKLEYVLRQGINPDINFQLMDLAGKRILDSKSVSNHLELNGIAQGLYLYRVTSAENKVIATGKLLIL